MKKNLQTGYSAALLELAGKLSLPEAALPVLQQAVTHRLFLKDTGTTKRETTSAWNFWAMPCWIC